VQAQDTTPTVQGVPPQPGTGSQPKDTETQLEELQFQDVEELSLEKLLDITISIAAGKAQTLEEAPGIATVVTDKEIRRMGAGTLVEVLQTVPGFEVLIDSRGRGRIVVRGIVAGAAGGSSENVLILFNGYRLNEEINGGATGVNLDIPVENLKRVEIIRGPGSALFGANAFVGVINLVTYSAEDIEGVEISASGGSFATQEYYALAGQIFGDVSLSGFVRYADTDGAQLHVPADAQTSRDLLLAPLGFSPASRAPGDTVDDHRAIDVNLQLAYKGFTFDARFKDEDAGGFIGPQDNLGDTELDSRQLLLGVSYRYPLGERGSVFARFGFTQSEIAEFDDVFPPGSVFPLPGGGGFLPIPAGVQFDFTLKSRRFSGGVLFDYQLFEGNNLTLGVSAANESTFDLELRSNVDPLNQMTLPGLQLLPFSFIEDSSRDIVSLFFQDTWNPLPQLGLTIGLRYEHYSDFGDTIDPRVGLVWRFAPRFHLKLLYGSAFRAPSFFELSVNVPNFLTGNPDLNPSTLQTFEAAVGYTWPNRLRLSANYFLTFIQDFIVPTASFVAGGATFINSSDIMVQGVEVEMQASFGPHTAFVNYTYQHPEVDGPVGRLPDVPSHLANLGASVAIGRYVRLTPTLLIRGSRPRVESDPRDDVPAYALVNVNLQVQNFFRTLVLSATVKNLFDEDYADPSPIASVPGDYPRPGRQVLIKATYKF
jgi:iron complex outermembrane receptor protein